MLIFLLTYVSTFSGQLYFRKSYFFTLLHSNYFDTTTTFSEQLFLQSSYYFWGAPFFKTFTSLQQLFFQNRNLLGAKLLPNSLFLRTGRSLGQFFFARATSMVAYLFRINIFTEELLIRRRDFCPASTYFRRVTLWKKQYPTLLTFLGASFLEWLTFQKTLLSIASTLQKSYFFNKYFFRRDTISQIRFLSVATLIYQLVFNWAGYQSRSVKMSKIFLRNLSLLKSHYRQSLLY